MLAVVGASGKLGFATINALLDHNLIPPERIVCTTSSDAGAKKLEKASARGVQVRHATFDDESRSFDSPLKGCTSLFLISSPRIFKDFHDAPQGTGREDDHFKVLQAAKRVGVKHVYYTSLAFANPSKSRVMKAHERTEDWITHELEHYTILREGLYNESWPLYLGHYSVPNDDRNEILVAGDSKINWTSIADLGLATATILASPSAQWNKKTVYLSQKNAHTLSEVAAMVSQARRKPLALRVVSREDHEKYYVQERGMEDPFIKWWSKTYDALKDNECEIDDNTLEDLFSEKGITPKSLQATIAEMFNSEVS